MRIPLRAGYLNRAGSSPVFSPRQKKKKCLLPCLHRFIFTSVVTGLLSDKQEFVEFPDFLCLLVCLLLKKKNPPVLKNPQWLDSRSPSGLRGNLCAALDKAESAERLATTGLLRRAPDNKPCWFEEERFRRGSSYSIRQKTNNQKKRDPIATQWAEHTQITRMHTVTRKQRRGEESHHVL